MQKPLKSFVSRPTRAAEIEPHRDALKHLDMQGPNLEWCLYARPRMMEEKQWFRHFKPEDVKKLGVSELYPRIGLFVEFYRKLLQRLYLDGNPRLSFSSPVDQVQDRIAPIKIWTAHTRHPNSQHIENHWTILVSLATASDLEVIASSRCSLCKLGFSRFQDSIMSMSRSGFMQDSQKTWAIWVLDNYSRTKPFMDVG